MAEIKTLRQQILEKRYLEKNIDGQIIETEEQMFLRVAKAVASAESKYGATDEEIEIQTNQFFELMSNGKFLPNSPTLMNAGHDKGMLSACYVFPIEDSIDGIFEAIKNTALTQKAGGGTGFSFDRLRPTGDMVTSSRGKTSGPMSFLRVFAETTHAVQQGAHRRGANMGMMKDDHPDILKFILAKEDPAAFNNFNLSVKITDRFMQKLNKTKKNM